MTLTMADLITSLPAAELVRREDARNVANPPFELIKTSPQGGEKVIISGPWKFAVVESEERPDRNLATGNSLPPGASRVVVLRFSPMLREKINRWHRRT